MQAPEGYVLLPQPIETEAHDLLKRRGIETVVAEGPAPQIVAPLLEKASAVLLRTGIRFTRELLAHADRLLHISRTGAGVDNVDLEAATDLGIIVTSSVGVNTDSVIEHALALLLALLKRLPLMDSETRRSNFAIRFKNLPKDARGKCLGVIGFGRIGSGLAEVCHRSLHMRIVAHDPYLDEASKKRTGSWVEFMSLEEVFRRADAVSVHIPLTNETRGLVGLECFRLMRPGGLLVNTSRGGVVRETDLVRALEEKLLAGAGLDVFETEPPDGDNPLLRMDNVILTPHTAALTGECVLEMAVKAVERVIRLIDGHLPDNVANPEVLSLERWNGLKRGPTSRDGA
jgi:D-3-phosphoglycerate dehydrogenase